LPSTWSNDSLTASAHDWMLIEQYSFSQTRTAGRVDFESSSAPSCDQ
jgi:hypothetical protein